VLPCCIIAAVSQPPDLLGNNKYTRGRGALSLRLARVCRVLSVWTSLWPVLLLMPLSCFDSWWR
jgi:hypothetical protein